MNNIPQPNEHGEYPLLRVGQAVRVHTGEEGTIKTIRYGRTKRYHVISSETTGGIYGAWEVTPTGPEPVDPIVPLAQQVGAALEAQSDEAAVELKQRLGEALSDEGYNLAQEFKGKIDFTDPHNVDRLLDRLMPIIKAACIVNAEVLTNDLLFSRAIQLHERMDRRDVWFWDIHGRNGLRSLTCPVVIDPKDMLEIFRTIRFAADCIDAVKKHGNHGIAGGDLERAGVQLRALHALGDYTQ